MATVTSSKRHLLVTSDTYTSNGDVTVGGDLFVNGSQTTINTATLDVEDKNITLNYGGNEASSQGAGITIAGSNATLIWDEANTRWKFSDSLVITDHAKMASGNVSGKFAVKSTDVHASYDFYNNGTSYFNDAVTVDADLTLSGGVDILMSDNSGAAVEFKQGTDLYMRFITTNGGEHIEVNKNMEIQGLTATAGTFSSTLTASNLSGTNTGDQVLPTDFVSKANGGTFDGNIEVQDISMGADDKFTHGSYLELSYGASNTSQFTFNADYDGAQTGTYTPHYSGTSGSGMSIVKMPSGGVGGLDFFVKNIASLVEFAPEPAITGILPSIYLTASLIRYVCSSTSIVGASPLVPTTTTPSLLHSI